jgi:hypothetical protein
MSTSWIWIGFQEGIVFLVGRMEEALPTPVSLQDCIPTEAEFVICEQTISMMLLVRM